jgi:hypothetical protein
MGRSSALVIPLCCCKLETRDTRDAFWLSYGDDGLMAKWFMLDANRLSTLLRRESWRLDSILRRLSNP